MLVECIPNVSEGRNRSLVDALAKSIRETEGVRLLEASSDDSHHRSVFTFVGDPEAVERAVVALYRCAIASIDLGRHVGVHPRIGAVDVVPFVPLDEATMADCVSLARRVGAAIALRHDIPVYLYEAAASRPERRRLEQIRRGGLGGLAARMKTPAWAPDFGPSAPHPTAGVSAVGARAPLIAFNVNLSTDRLEIAREIARVVRASSGGLAHVKAIGVPLPSRGIVQVSTNLTDYTRTPLAAVYAAVAHEAAKRGVAVIESEIVGLVPEAAVTDDTAAGMRITGFSPEKVLEHRLRHRRTP